VAAMTVTGRVVRVSGSLVQVAGIGDVAMYDVVVLGRQRISGEVVAIEGDLVTTQAYEDTGGLAVDDPAEPTGLPLSAPLGPWLLGGIFDGLLRPLGTEGPWLSPGMRAVAPPGRTWAFRPAVTVGDRVLPGDVLGTVGEESVLAMLLTVPPGVSGEVAAVADAGDHPAEGVLVTVDGVDVRLSSHWPVRRPRPVARRLESSYEGLHTGQRVLDLVYPIARGSTASVPGGFGTGKTMLLQQIAKWCDADVIVYVGCGERGNEMADVLEEFSALVDPRTGEPLSRRTVVVANTSNMPMMAREASIYSGATVAEYFRDMGLHVVVIADSTSRWAEALREFASRTGALPAEEGYPAGLASALAAFYERAGHVETLGGRRGSVTIIGAVSPPGGDLVEPVTAHTQRFVRSVWMLDRDLAYARHYPAVAWAGSFSRDAEPLGAWHARGGDLAWSARRVRVTDLLAQADRLESLADLVGTASLPGTERVVMVAGRLLREALLQQSALSPNDAFCSPGKGAALADTVLAVVDRCLELVSGGLPVALIEEVDFGPLVRAREETGPDDADGVHERRDRVLATLGALS
jgi:V/A-type H+-transporting ATPase subunit A